MNAQDVEQKQQRKPVCTIAGLAIFLTSIAWGIIIGTASARAGGYGGILVIMVWMVAVPTSAIFGIIGLARNESPRWLAKTLLILCLIPVALFVVEILLVSTSNS